MRPFLNESEKNEQNIEKIPFNISALFNIFSTSKSSTSVRKPATVKWYFCP